MKILAAGGDGTVAWVLQTVYALDLQPHPAVAVMPLGTGNDLALSFGWGNAFQPSWIKVGRWALTFCPERSNLGQPWCGLCP